MRHAAYAYAAMLAGLLLTACGATAQEGRPLPGLSVAQRLCAECHAILKDQIRSPHPDAPRFEDIAATPGMSAIALTVALRTSHDTMPNLVIPADELRDVIAYILTLR